MTQDAAVRACHRPGVLRMDFQPIIDTARGTVVGYEALARFTGPPHAPPDRWFAVARAAGVGAELEAQALRTALDGAVRAAAELLPLRQRRPGCTAHRTGRRGVRRRRRPARRRRRDHRADRGGQLRRPSRAIAPLRAAGALLAVDDAGAGFASLKHITVLRPDFVKVDRDLVAGIDIDETKAAVVEALGMFASRLDAWLIAEGVETAAELDRLLSLRVPLAQGYGLGPPRPVMGAARLRRGRAVPAADDRRHLRRPLRPRRTGPAGDRGRGRPRRVRRGSRRRLGHGRRRVRPAGQPDRPVRRAHPPLRVLPSEPLADVARRIASRPADERHVPVVLCDERGRLVGLVTVERLLCRLADALDVHSVPP